MCNNCPSSCFDQTNTNCIEYTGKSFPDLGIVQGNSLTSSLESLLSELNSVKSKTNGDCNDNPNQTTQSSESQSIGNVDALQTGNTTSMTRSSISVDTMVSGSGFTINYNAADVISECGGNLTTFTATVSGVFNESASNVRLESSNSQIGQFKLSVTNCPVTLTIEGVVLVGSTQKIVSYSRRLDCVNAQIKEFAVLKDFSQSSPITTQAGLNERLVSQINSLQTNIQSLLNSTVDGNSLAQTVANQQSLLQDQDSVISTLNGTIEALQNRIDIIERTI